MIRNHDPKNKRMTEFIPGIEKLKPLPEMNECIVCGRYLKLKKDRRTGECEACRISTQRSLYNFRIVKKID